MDFVSGALWHLTAYSLMSHQFISLFINTLNAKMIWEAMGLLRAQPLSPFLPVPLQTQGSSPLAIPPRGFFLTIAHAATLLFMGVGLLVFYTLCRTLRWPWRGNHIQERMNSFLGLKRREPGPKEQSGSPPHTLWVQSLFLCARYLACEH